MENGYRFYSKGEYYATCWTNEVAENHISACADLAHKGMTPYYWHNPVTRKDILTYTDSFKIEKLTSKTATVITPDNIGLLAKSIQKELAKFEYDGEEWKVKGEHHERQHPQT